MKYLTQIIKEQQSALFDECGAFFAFNEEQLKEGMQGRKAEEYASFGTGLLVLKEHAEKLDKGLIDLRKQGIKKDIALHGLPAIIQRELGNYECQFGGDTSRVKEVLDDYPDVTDEMIDMEYAIFFQKCIDNDWF